MKRVEGRPTSIKKVKQRAREIRDEQRIPLNQALELASQEVGFQNYHEALKALDTTGASPPSSETADGLGGLSQTVRRALDRMHAFQADDRQFHPMSEALSRIYDQSASSEDELRLARACSLNQGDAELLTQWLGTAMTATELDGPRFGVTIAVVLEATDPARLMPVSLGLEDEVALGDAIQKAIGLADTKVSISPVGLLLSPLEAGATMTDWLSIVTHGGRMAAAAIEGTMRVERSGRSLPDTGKREGRYYAVVGRATAAQKWAGILAERVRNASIEGLPVPALSSTGNVSLRAIEAVEGDGLTSWLYRDEVAEAASYLARVLDEEGVSASHARLAIRVWPSVVQMRVDVVVKLPNRDGIVDRERSAKLCDSFFPAYLLLGLRKALGGSVEYELGQVAQQ